jgi:predicted nuclease with TOPRIM domain
MLGHERAEALAAVRGYEQKISELEQEMLALREAATKNAGRLEAELGEKQADLARYAEMLTALETAREQWALERATLQGKIGRLERILELAGQSRWLRLGRSLGLGPAIGER